MTPDETVLQVAAALRARVRHDPYRTLGLAAAVGLASGARFWRLLFGAGARIALAAVVPSLIDSLQREEQHGDTAGS